MYNGIDVKKFVDIWTQASLDGHGRYWIAEKLKADFLDVTNLRTALANKGVQLPPLHKGSESFLGQITVSDLNDSIQNAIVAAAKRTIKKQLIAAKEPQNHE